MVGHIGEFRKLTWFERILWRLAFWFQYQAMKLTFGKCYALEQYKQNLAVLTPLTEVYIE